jgi:hypothetical protein
MSGQIATSLGANVDFAIFLVVAAFGFVFGFFTVRGSGINNHPWGHTDSPGAKLPDEFHQFADRQIHDADERRARREGRQARTPAATPVPLVPETPAPAVAAASDDMTIDDINRRLAAENERRRATAPAVSAPRESRRS